MVEVPSVTISELLLLRFSFNANEVVTSVELAFKAKAVCVAFETGLSASVVLSTLVKPTIVLSIPETVPVKVGDARFAFKANEVVTSEAFAFNAKPGTVGKSAVPAKSPANFIFPLVVVSESTIVAPVMAVST